MIVSPDGLVRITPDTFSKIRMMAGNAGIDPALVLGVIEQESSWDPLAVRLEEGFYLRYVRPLVEAGTIPPSEGVLRATSFGLMQTMLESVREIGYTGTADQLTDPITGVEWGLKLLARKIEATTSITAALLAWNGGGDPSYPTKVAARMGKYQPASNASATQEAASGEV